MLKKENKKKRAQRKSLRFYGSLSPRSTVVWPGANRCDEQSRYNPDFLSCVCVCELYGRSQALHEANNSEPLKVHCGVQYAHAG